MLLPRDYGVLPSLVTECGWAGLLSGGWPGRSAAWVVVPGSPEGRDGRAGVIMTPAVPKIMDLLKDA